MPSADELALLLDHEITAVVTAMRQNAKWAMVPARYGVRPGASAAACVSGQGELSVLPPILSKLQSQGFTQRQSSQVHDSCIAALACCLAAVRSARPAEQHISVQLVASSSQPVCCAATHTG